MKLNFSKHALQQMEARNIPKELVEEIVSSGSLAQMIGPWRNADNVRIDVCHFYKYIPNRDDNFISIVGRFEKNKDFDLLVITVQVKFNPDHLNWEKLIS